MKEKNEEELTGAHQIIWKLLRSAKDGERILGVDLRAAAGGLKQRVLHHIIRDLRRAGLFIGASKNVPYGYYEIRTRKELLHYVSHRRKELIEELEELQEMEFQWNVKEAQKRERELIERKK